MPLLKYIISLFFLIGLALLTPIEISAQEDGNVTINSDPQGSLIKLTGDITFSGVTPIRFDRPLSGEYKVEVLRDGFESYRSKAYFSESQQSELNVRLVPKTRVKSFLRSMIIPGWGQRYYGNSTKATLLTVGIAASAISYYFVKTDYDDKVEIYNEKKAARDNAIHWSDIGQLDRELYEAQKAADDAEDWVNIMTVATVGIYAFNLLDSYFLFPDISRFTEYKALTVKPDVSQDMISFTLAMEF
jgi:hypothetical protein